LPALQAKFFMEITPCDFFFRSRRGIGPPLTASFSPLHSWLPSRSR
jgi:hypothetical protein